MTDDDVTEDSTDVYIPITADKPGREVLIGTQTDDERNLVSLEIASTQPGGNDRWTWLAPTEAHEVAAALTVAAEAMEPDRLTTMIPRLLMRAIIDGWMEDNPEHRTTDHNERAALIHQDLTLALLIEIKDALSEL